LYDPNGTVPFSLEILFHLYGTLLARTFAASFAALESDKCVTGPKLPLALTSSKTPAEFRRLSQRKVQELRAAQPARLRLCAEEKLNSAWLLPVFISG